MKSNKLYSAKGMKNPRRRLESRIKREIRKSNQRASRAQSKRYPLTIEDPFGGKETIFVEQKIRTSANQNWNKLKNKYNEAEGAGALKTYRDAQGKIAVIRLPDEKEFKRNWMLGKLHGQKESEMFTFYASQYFNVSAQTAQNILFAQYDNKDDTERKSSLAEYVKENGILSATYWDDYGRVGERKSLGVGERGDGYRYHPSTVTISWDNGASDEENIARMAGQLRNVPRRAIMALYIAAFGEAGKEDYKEKVSNYDF